MSSNAENLKRLTIIEELNNLLSDEYDVRQAAEKNMKKLEVTEGYGFYLTEVILDKSFDLPLRQIACIMLKHYVEDYWANTDIGDDANLVSGWEVIDESTKKAIRSELPNGLYDPNSKIRSAVAHTISTIAAIDWPVNWPNLFDILFQCLENGEDSIHGAIQVLGDDFTYDEDQIKHLALPLITHARRIFDSEEKYSIKTRASVLSMLKPFLVSININIAKKPKYITFGSTILNEMIPKMLHYLSMSSGQTLNFYMRKEIVKLLTFLVSEMPYCIQVFFEEILPVIWQVLTQIADTYVKICVNKVEPNPFPGKDKADDDDDESANFDNMIIQIFDLIQALICSERKLEFRSAFNDVLTDLIYIIIVFIQLPEDKIAEWKVDLEKFVEDEYDGSMELTIRVAGQDVLDAVEKDLGAKLLPPLQMALTRHMTVTAAEKNAGNAHWWKIQEASMVAVHCYRDLILGAEDQFDLLNYLSLIRNCLNYSHNTFLIQGALNNLSAFCSSKIYTYEMLEEVLNAILQSLQPEKPNTLKICAVEATYDIISAHKNTDDKKRELIKSKLLGLSEGILPLLPSSFGSVTSKLLEALNMMIQFDVTFATTLQNKLIPMLLQIFLKYSDDPIIVEVVQLLIKSLCKNPHCSLPLQEVFVPNIIDILLQQNDSSDAVKYVALDVLTIIVRRSTTPLSTLLMDRAFPTMVQVTLKSDDLQVMVTGGECLQAYIHVAPEQVCKFKNGEGLNYIMEITTMLLNPMAEELTACKVGSLIITIITKLGNMLGENVDMILKAVVSKMQLGDVLKVVISLVVVFAYLILTQMEATLNFLSTVPGPNGEPAIQFVLSKWLLKQNSFFGTYETKVTIMALCKLFEYGVTTQDPRLISINIQEAFVPEASLSESRVRTRSQVNKKEIVTMPALVKIFKLLINEVYHLREAKQADSESVTDDECEHSFKADGDCNDDAVGMPDAESPVTSPKVRFNYHDFYEDDDNDPDYEDGLMEDLMKNPLFQTDTEKYLTKFLRHFSSNEHYPMFFNQLTVSEKNILKSLESNIAYE